MLFGALAMVEKENHAWTANEPTMRVVAKEALCLVCSGNNVPSKKCPKAIRPSGTLDIRILLIACAGTTDTVILIIQRMGKKSKR